jgi:hypothetical protein
MCKTYTAEGAIGKYLIVKFGANDGGALQATASSEKFLGISRDLSVTAANITAGEDRIDVVRDGITPVILGGTVTRGDRLTADANGKAITAAPGAGVNMETVGTAEISGVAGDIIDCFVNPTRIQG